MACRGYCLLKWLACIFADNEANVSPGLCRLKTIQTVAGSNAGLAASAFIQVYLEGVLFARTGLAERNEIAVIRLHSRKPTV